MKKFFIIICITLLSSILPTFANTEEYLNLNWWKSFNDDCLINNLITVSQNNYDLKNTALKIKEKLDISSGTSDYDCDLTDPKLIFAVLIPIEKACDVKVDDGFGGQVQFGSSNTWYSNGNVSIELDGIEYQVFGELYPIAGNVKFYVTIV